MNVLYLYSELMGYQIPVLREYAATYNAEVHVVHWNHKKLTSYVPPAVEGVAYYNRSEYDLIKLKELVEKVQPDIVYISGWMDKDYIKVGKLCVKNGIPVVSGSDTQWRGNLKQRLGTIYFKMFLKNSYTHLWVAGPYQYEYARKLGFKKNEIIFNSLTADIETFSTYRNKEVQDIPKKLLFLGRFEKIKGIDLLIKAWGSIKDKRGWSLSFIGSGSMREELEKLDDVEVLDFMPPEELSKVIHNYGCLVLPSTFEPWALVIHEAMVAGMPVIASDACGAAPVFVVPDYTGYIFESNSTDSLKQSILNIINADNDKLKRMSNNAIEQARVITPQKTAASFMSILK